MTDCASTNTIAALLAGAADPAAAARLEVHLDECAACRRLVADLGRGLSAIGEATPLPFAHALPRPGDSIGRYQIQRVIGVGGMGVVYEAHDTTLDRRVAVKLLRPDLAEGPNLLAEAQAMARLQHPHIVVVHDAGLAAGQLYVCMEHVQGSTLRAWVAAQPRDWRAIATAFAAAGEGLAYVHRAGLVHLDFKPDNVLVDRDGRVRVTDFGLARLVGASPSRAIVGTPAYMAPEQRSGEPTDARSDQYAFCVSLREALGETRAPRWLLAVIERGLAAHRDDRFATMDELLAALHAGLSPRRSRAAALAVVAASGAAALLGSSVSGPDVITRFVQVPVAHAVTEVRDVGTTAAREPQAPPSTNVIAIRELATPTAARGYMPPRRAPVLHLEPPALATFAATLVASDDAGDEPAAKRIGAGYCDDGSALSCGWWAPSCPEGTVIAIQQGCWTCADVQTCGPLGFPRTCNDGTPLRCNQPPPVCQGRQIASVRNGCWSCEDAFACWSWTAQPSQPPPRKPPPPAGTGSSSGSNGGPGSGACGNGFCEAGETHAACARDCCETTGSGECLAKCGNGFCETGEDHASCAADCCELGGGSGGCAPVCGNGFCEDGETCPADC